MCGIVGYYGPQDPKKIIIDGLAQLEYRGYDSAGVAILDGGKFKRIRATGKLSELAGKLENVNFEGRLGIGHTRWATHGVPSEGNAHPHQVEGICIVHNGIIENYMEIREELKATGATIESDTDSELVAHLIAREIKMLSKESSGKTGVAGRGMLEQVIPRVISKLHGAYAIVAVNEAEPETLVAFKNGPPLICGTNEREVIVASDVQALVQTVRNCIYIDDGEIFVSKGLSWKVLAATGEVVDKKPIYIDWTPERAEKHGFSHFMLKEIHEQPRALAMAIEPFIDLAGPSIKRSAFPEKEWANIERIIFVACGTSYYASMAGEYLIERMARIPVELEFASEFRYRNPIVPKNTMIITISQSGETADTLAALRMAKAMGAKTLSICNVKNSTIDREADIHFYMRSGVEVSVASTKAFTCTLSILNCIALYLGVSRGLVPPEEEKKYVQELLGIAAEVEKMLNYTSFFQDYAESFKKFRGFLYLGRGINYPIALEGALKLKEIAYMHAEGYAAGEMKHGPIALIDSEIAVVVVAPNDDVYEKTVSNLEEVRARGAQVISFGTGENKRLASVSKHYLPLPEVGWNINPILTVVPLQLLAFYIAKALGHDVDQPRNLAKSVTVE